MEADENIVENNIHFPSTVGASDDEIDTTYHRLVDQRMSEEQLKLPYLERNLIHEEIHGIATHLQKETPELLRSSLSQLSCELNELVSLDYKNDVNPSEALSAGYLLSRRGRSTRARCYVNNANFRLRFLRTENFDAKKAAVRLMKFMNVMLQFFGADALYRPVKITDFTRSELKKMQAGWVQPLPFRDRSGRKVFVCSGNLGLSCDPLLRIRIFLYIFLAGTRDIESQQRGTISVVLPSITQDIQSTWSTRDEIDYISYTKITLDAIPIKTVAVHFCFPYNDGRFSNFVERIHFRFLISLVSSIYPRLKLHVGGKAELSEKLSGYGIPVTLIPSTYSGTVKTSCFRTWLKIQRRKDALELAKELGSQMIDCPGLHDVVFRQGTNSTANPGNVMFWSLIESKISNPGLPVFGNYIPESTIAKEIFDKIVYRRKGRFLKWESSLHCWVEFEDVSEIITRIGLAYNRSRQKNALIIDSIDSK